MNLHTQCAPSHCSLENIQKSVLQSYEPVMFVQLHSSLFQTKELCYMHRQLLLDSQGRVTPRIRASGL